MDELIRHIYSSAWEEGVDDAGAAIGPADVVVCLTNGEKFVASFFSYDQIAELRRVHQASGEFLHGAYFWSKHLVLVENCGPPFVRRVVEHLLEEGELAEVFDKV